MQISGIILYLLLAASFFVSDFKSKAYAQIPSFTVETVNLNERKDRGKFDATLFSTLETMVDDENFETTGVENFLNLSLRYRFAGVHDFVLRQGVVSEFYLDNIENDNEDKVGNTEFHHNYFFKELKKKGFRLRLSSRFIFNSNVNDRLKFNSYGFFQVRAFYGFKINSLFRINRFTSYARVTRYLVRDSSDGARTWDLRFKIAPEIVLTDKLAFGVAFEYTNYYSNSNASNPTSENVEVTPNFWYQYKRNLAFGLFANFVPIESHDQRNLVKEYDKLASFGLNVFARLF